jgi:hypothetical protein
MKWKKELEALVEESRAFVKSVQADLPAKPPIVGPLPEPVADAVETGQPTEFDARPEEPPAHQPSFDNHRTAPPLTTGSERGDIERRIEMYRALQRKRLQDQDAFYEREMARIRDGLR